MRLEFDDALDDAFSFSIRPYRLVTSLVSPVIRLNLSIRVVSPVKVSIIISITMT
jgi:hypothetical protein